MELVSLVVVVALLNGATPQFVQGGRAVAGARDKLDARLLPRLRADPGGFVPVDIVLAEQCPEQMVGAAVDFPSKADRREHVVSLLKGTALASQEPLVHTLEAWRAQGRVRGRIHRLWIHNVVSAEVRLADVAELAVRPDVALVHYDPPRGEEVLLGAPAVAGTPTCGVTRIRAPEVWSTLNITGRGVVVGVIDSGVCEFHPDIRDRLWKNPREGPGNGIDDDRNGFVDDLRGWNFDAETANIDDTSVHGSHVSGTVAGTGLAGTACGVAPGAQVMTMKVFESSVSESSVWRSIEYGVENGADVLTGSLGWPHRLDPDRATWRTVCNNAIAAGVVVLFAAGNDGCRTLFNNVRTPADVPDVIAVGAVACNDREVDFSSCGPTTWQRVPGYRDFPYPPGLTKPDVSAPGLFVTSHFRCKGYFFISGTSMATPHVAGLAALLLEADPTLDHFGVKAILEETATDLGEPGKDNRYGSGRIDAFAAVKRAFSDFRRQH